MSNEKNLEIVLNAARIRANDLEEQADIAKGYGDLDAAKDLMEIAYNIKDACNKVENQ